VWVLAVTRRPPGAVVADRGFGTAANDQAVQALGVKRVGLQRTGTPGKARLAVERTADQLARSLGIPHDSPQRVKAGLQFALSKATEDGHCYLPEPELVTTATAHAQ